MIFIIFYLIYSIPLIFIIFKKSLNEYSPLFFSLISIIIKQTKAYSFSNAIRYLYDFSLKIESTKK